MLKDKKIAFIGSGQMAQAMIAGLIRNEAARPENLFASGPRPERGEELKERYGLVATTDNKEAVKNADIVVLSVKPQRLDTILGELEGSIKKGALVLSIIAGASMDKH